MTKNIVSLNGAPVEGQTTEPSEYVIETLEDMLERAKSGKLIGVAIVGMENDGATPYMLVGKVGGFGMVGALQGLQFELNTINTARD